MASSGVKGFAMSRLEAFRVALSKTAMPIDSSKFFDSIRIKPTKVSAKRQAQARERSHVRMGGLQEQGRAPRAEGPRQFAEYWHFCLDHVREYNQSYNFFSGHESGRGRALPEGCADRPSSDLEDGRQYQRQEGQGAEADLEGASDPFQHVQRAQRPRPLAAGSGRAGARSRRKRARSSTPSARRCR